jgi:hypothetical protein
MGKEPNRLQELARAVRRYTAAHGGTNPFVTAIEGFTILRSEHAKQPSHRIFKPALCITVQGAKWATFGEQRYDYRAGQALVVSVEMPSRGTVSAASPTEPFLGLVIKFDRAIMQDVMEELGMRLKPSGSEKARGAFVTDLSSQLADCALRGVRLLETPEAIPTLYPGIMREICYWLLTEPGGDQIVHMTTTLLQCNRLHDPCRQCLSPFLWGSSNPSLVRGQTVAIRHRHPLKASPDFLHVTPSRNGRCGTARGVRSLAKSEKAP